jgi:hypothetical protein
MAVCQRGGPVPLPGAFAPRAAFLEALVLTRLEAKRDHEEDRAQREVHDRADRVLRGFDHARSFQREHDHEADRDARHHRPEQVAEHQLLGVRQEQHHNRDGNQRRIRHRGQGEDENLSHNLSMIESIGSCAPHPPVILQQSIRAVVDRREHCHGPGANQPFRLMFPREPPSTLDVIAAGDVLPAERRRGPATREHSGQPRRWEFR